MSKPLIVIADTDETYLATLENKFLCELDDKVELELISDAIYFDDFFSTPVTAEIVIIDEKLYTSDLQKHNIENLFILSESKEQGGTEELSVTRVFKYLGVRELYNELTYQSAGRLEAGEAAEQTTQIIALCSAAGGTGKTGLSIGLAKCLAAKHKRILYLSTESMQSFAFYLENKSGMPNDGYRAIKEDASHIYQNIRFFLRKEAFSYLPPFMSTLDARNLTFGIYENMIQGAKESGEYDFIIIDMEAGYSQERVKLLLEADKVMLIAMQDAVSTYKMEYMMRNLDFRDREKYMIIMNRYDGEKENLYLKSELQTQFPVKEYVDDAKRPLESADQLAKLDGIMKISYMFI